MPEGNEQEAAFLDSAVAKHVLTVLALAGESSALETLLVAIRTTFPLLWGSALLSYPFYLVFLVKINYRPAVINGLAGNTLVPSVL